MSIVAIGSDIVEEPDRRPGYFETSDIERHRKQCIAPREGDMTSGQVVRISAFDKPSSFARSNLDHFHKLFTAPTY